MNLYIDDDSVKGSLIARLKKLRHQITVPADVSLSGAADPRHLLHAAQCNLILLTKNYEDFRDLHRLVQATRGVHPGILAIRFDNDPSRDMKDAEIARAIRNLERSGAPLVNEFHILNHWR